jgi:hypothetical protein
MLANNVMNTVYTKGSDLLKKFTESKFGQGLIDGLAHSGLNEGFEEVTEEFGTDIVKALALGLEALGVKVTEDPLQKLDFRFDPKEMLQRYAASFVGGFIGGTIFKGYEWYDNLQHGQAMIHNIQDLNKRLAWYDRNGYYDKALQMLERMHDKHELPADINKSILDFAEVDNLEAAKYEDNSKIAFLSANDPKRSQHEYLYQVVKGRLMSVHEALEQHLGKGILMNDEDLNKAV